MDDLDTALLRLLIEEPRAGMREYARVLGVARGTVQSRLARLERSNAVVSYAPRIAPEALGFGILAFVHLQAAQGRLETLVKALADVTEVLEAHSITGEGDLFCRIVARNNAHLEVVIQSLVALPGVVRARTEIALNEHIGYRVVQLLTTAR
jgi:DNA-binding Lrp family transcriptional regulator